MTTLLINFNLAFIPFIYVYILFEFEQSKKYEKIFYFINEKYRIRILIILLLFCDVHEFFSFYISN